MDRPPAADRPAVAPCSERLWLKVLLLAAPVVAEQVLHSLVGFTDTWLANHLVPVEDLTGDQLASAHKVNQTAAAAVGSVTYVLWLVGMLASSVGVGASALISRATGARHRGLANAVVGQAVLSAAVIGTAFGVGLVLLASHVAPMTGLPVESHGYFSQYVATIGWAMPFAIVMIASAACLRGAGDTLSPAIAVIAVDLLNLVISFALVRGWLGLPAMGFSGIAMGTAIAYCIGAVLQVGLLRRRRARARLHLHRLPPRTAMIRRMFRIGLPSGAEMLLQWSANFGVLFAVNTLGAVSATVHLNAIRLEAFSFLTGMGFATAAATLVGQSLGMKNPARARRCAYLAYAWGGGAMCLMGLLFVFGGQSVSGLLSDDPQVIALSGTCLLIAGFVQPFFAAAMIFSGALRGAGDTVRVMQINLGSIIAARLIPVLLLIWLMPFSVVTIWVVLCVELCIRGGLMAWRFKTGAWEHRRL